MTKETKKTNIIEEILDWKVLVWGLVPRNPSLTKYNLRRYMSIFRTLSERFPIIYYGLRHDGGLVVVPKRFEVIWRAFFDLMGFDIIVFREETIREHLIDGIETWKAWNRVGEDHANILLKKLRRGGSK